MGILFSVFFAMHAWALEPEYHGYMRAGAGSNGKGAKQECFSNQGAPGNEFRLGNECTVYGEAALKAPFLKGGETDPFFFSQVRLAYFPPGDSAFEDNDSDGRDINVVEAFIEGGNLDGSSLSYWAGKRFYRNVDLHIYDWEYFASMNGNGAGIGNIPLGTGKLSAAFLFETGSTRSNIGRNQVQVLDLRWFDVAIGRSSQLNFWAAYANAPAGTANGIQYVKRDGWLGGVRWRKNMRDGFNDLAVVHGRNLLESISLYGDSSLEKGPGLPPGARRWRIVEHLSVQPLARFGIQAAVAAQFWDSRTPGTDSRGRWWSVGARPIYFFSDHTSLAFEAGHSVVRDFSERNSDGSPVGNRTLTRFTIAPQIAVGKGVWARPVLRAFYTRSFWNGANKSRIASGAPSYSGSLSGQSIGFQGEVWF